MSSSEKEILVAKRKKTKAKVKAKPKKRGRSVLKEASLPNAELDVMACLWKDGESTARNIRETMWKYRPMAHGSVVTLLTRLEAKGMVNKRKGSFGKAFIFKPSRPPETTYRSLTKDMVRRVFGGDSVKMVSSLLDAHTVTKEDCDAIVSTVNSARRKAKSGKSRRR